MKNSILGIGALNLDIIVHYKDGDKIDEFVGDEEIEVEEDEWWKIYHSFAKKRYLYCCPGGSSANTIAAIASFGDRRYLCGFLGILGRDKAAEIVLKDNVWEEVELIASSDTNKPTGRCFSYVHRDNKRRLRVAPGANDDFKFNDNDLSRLDKFNWIHISPFTKEESNKQILLLLNKID